MGSGLYSTVRSTDDAGNISYARSDAARTVMFNVANRAQTFSNKEMHRDMDPKNIQLRESRDSVDHPNSFPIVLGLDVTGSMGSIPEYLVKKGLPHLMGSIIDGGVPDPQLLFLGIGDHIYDSAPLQVGQFESSDELLDKWLTNVWLEGRGGNNAGESYMLAWYFAAKHTVTDSFCKRGKKGIVFTVGDEPVLPNIDARSLGNIIGPHEEGELQTTDILKLAQESWNVYHIHIASTFSGSREGVQRKLLDLLGENLIILEDPNDIPQVICDKVLEVVGSTIDETIEVIDL